MSYNIQVPSKTPEFYLLEDIVWTYKDFVVYKRFGMLSLELKEHLIGELFCDDISKSRYKTYENWIKYLKEKDLKKIRKSKALAEQLLKDCKTIESIWKNS